MEGNRRVLSSIPHMSIAKHVSIYAVVFAGVAVICYFSLPKASEDDSEPPGFEELGDCYVATSLDNKKSLHLSRNHEAKFSDKSGLNNRWDTGTWELVDEDKRVYRIKVDGQSIDYTLVKTPNGDSCFLAAGTLEAVDLKRSWFPALTDSDD